MIHKNILTNFMQKCSTQKFLKLQYSYHEMNALLDFLLLLLSVEEWRKKHEIATVRIAQLDSSHSSFASELQRLSRERDELQV